MTSLRLLLCLTLPLLILANEVATRDTDKRYCMFFYITKLIILDGSAISCSGSSCTGTLTLNSDQYAYVSFTSPDGLNPEIGYTFSGSGAFQVYLVDQSNFNIIANGGTAFSYYTSYSAATDSTFVQYPGSGGTGYPPTSGTFYIIVISTSSSNNVAYSITIQSSGTTSGQCCVTECGGESKIITANCGMK
jgi:hypothetical protein